MTDHYNIGDDPADAAYVVRDKPLWKCSNCGKEIWATDVAMTMALSSGGRINYPVTCTCGHTDGPGELRLYGKTKKAWNDRIRKEIDERHYKRKLGK